ncbi:MAG: transcription antitermination factor NusB [Oscillospiraceae bacterium]|nr:transcription antitermination factor NusB [Oscillospiraceae bacterium]
MTRGNARELAVHLIYGRNFTGEEPEQVVYTRLDREYYPQLSAENDIYAERPSKAQVRYLDSVVSGVANREEELNAIIQKFSIGWDVSRISRLTRCIMQLAIFEILHMEDVPTGVAISEAVRLAKKYDSNETGSFVNGILGSYARSLTAPAAETPVQEDAAPEVPVQEAPEEN